MWCITVPLIFFLSPQNFNFICTVQKPEHHPTRERRDAPGCEKNECLAFLAWSDFHARSRFARCTIPDEKWGLLVVYRIEVVNFTFYRSKKFSGIF